MKCNNKYCCFQAFDSCCHESEEGFDNATPNQLDCPSSVREDLENELYEYATYLQDHFEDLKPRYQAHMTRFILEQRHSKTKIDILLDTFSRKTNFNMSTQMRTLSELVEVKKQMDKLEENI
ncbi:hypothetical protein PPISBEST_147 [Bacillus phage PPIsBest]|uniref:Uncharacterized protein n=1 Tax=Bacillus phage PPIsBest TaxID=2024234 RepID=A0A222Z2W7_9CAUD|nr:hypothetical protein PPISBEST_147 [Bacillus phage PPIsBest]